MAYTPIGTYNDKDLEKAIQDQLAAYSRQYENSKAAGDRAGMDKAHSDAESIRSQYGYSGGVDGSSYLPTPQKQTQKQAQQPSFDYESPPSYTSKYESRIDGLLNDILNRDDFSYDHTTDPLYSQYAQTYQREGQRSMQDTLGAVAANTGGLASSYATTAAQQAGNYYAAKQGDIIPELYQLAYSQYLDGIDGKVRDLGLLDQMDSSQYNRYRDTMSDWRGDRDFAYGQHRDELGDSRYDQEWQYQTGRDQVNDSRYNQEWQYQVGRDQVSDQRYVDERDYARQQDSLNRAYQQNQDAYNRAMQSWDMLGYLDETSAKTLGLPQGTKNAGYSYQLAQLAQQRSGGGSGSGSSGGSGSDSASETDTSLNTLFMEMQESGSPEAYAYQNAKRFGLNSDSAIKAAIASYQDWEKDGIWSQIDQSRMKAAGLSGLSYEQLEKMVERGELVVKQTPDGMLYFHWANDKTETEK